MKNSFDILRITRENILNLCEPLSIDQLNTIPKGFNNNLLWNLGHVIATQQLLVYGLSGLPTQMGSDRINRYRKGTKPEGWFDQEEYQYLQELALLTVDQMKNDFESGIFKEFKTYTTSYRTTLSDVKQAILFNNVHEGMHFGTMIAMKKLVMD